MREVIIIPSKLERTLIEGGYSLIELFFASWPLDMVFYISRVSYLMANIVKGYVASKWDHRKLLSRWVIDVDGLLNILDSTGSFICGPVVADFFDGGSSTSSNLDICVTEMGFVALVGIMGPERYRHRIQEVFASSFRPTIPEKVFTFRFHRDFPSLGSITAHLVRGDPLKFILHCATSKS